MEILTNLDFKRSMAAILDFLNYLNFPKGGINTSYRIWLQRPLRTIIRGEKMYIGEFWVRLKILVPLPIMTIMDMHHWSCFSVELTL